MAALYDDQPPPSGAPPWRSLLKSSAIIFLRNLHHLLYLAALCFLLSYLLITASTSLRSLLSDLLLFFYFTNSAWLTYSFTLPETNWSLAGLPAYDYNKPVDSAAIHQLYDPPAASRSTKVLVFVTLVLTVSTINTSSVINDTQAYLDEAAKMVEFCGGFGIVVLLGTLGWTMYSAQRLTRSGGENLLMHEPALQKGADEYYNSRSAAIASSMRSIGHCMVKASMWVSFVAVNLTCVIITIMNWCGGEGQADRHAGSAQALFKIGALVVGVSVIGLPAVLCAVVLSTKASLDVSIHKLDGHAHKSIDLLIA